MQVRKVILTGPDHKEAAISFKPGANVLAGQSDTGKSFIFHCIDYIFGADDFKKQIPEAEGYSQLYVELEDLNNVSITLERSLHGGDLKVHYCKYNEIVKDGETVLAKRNKGKAKDITSVLLPFSNINGEAKLRKNDRGETQRLSIRTLIPIFMVNEVAMIDDKSLIVSDGTFDKTARKRMFAYLLSGKDDTGIIAAVQDDIVNARNSARLDFIDEMLSVLEDKIGSFTDDSEESILKIENAIHEISNELTRATESRVNILEELHSKTADLQRAETQLIATDEVLKRYELLNKRYESDLDRLDFIAEGAHYFSSLQEIHCPHCNQLMDSVCEHVSQHKENIYEGARVEAGKIKSLKSGLSEVIKTMETRRETWRRQEEESKEYIISLEERLNLNLTPKLTLLYSNLNQLIERRVMLEGIRHNQDQFNNLKLQKKNIEDSAKSQTSKTSKWDSLPSAQLRKLCKSIEDVLVEWNWGDHPPRVDFDQKKYDILVDGQSRQSHGKGIRSILYSAFVIGLLRYCTEQGKPHPGFVILDSPLTSYRKSPSINQKDGAVAAKIETGFWDSLTKLKPNIQVIVIENKEPSSKVATAVHYEWFAGDTALPGQRAGFIPKG